MNSLDGRTKANAAIVPASANAAVSVFASNTTDLVLDTRASVHTSQPLSSKSVRNVAKPVHYRFQEEILLVLREAESGTAVVEICRKHGISQQSFFLWKKKYTGLGLSELRELRQLRDENEKLKGWWRIFP